MRSVRSEVFYVRSGAAVGQEVYFPKRAGLSRPPVRGIRFYANPNHVVGDPNTLVALSGYGKAAGVVVTFRATGGGELLVNFPLTSFFAGAPNNVTRQLKRLDDLPIDPDFCSVTTTDANGVSGLYAIQFEYATL